MIFYNAFIALYGFAIWVASFFNPKAAKWIEGRKDWKKKLGTYNFSGSNWVWFHCSSFGEFQEGRNVIEQFRKQYPGYKILLTFFSPSGYEATRNFKGTDVTLYMPLDSSTNAGFFLDTIKPKAIFFIRTDIWPNYINAASERNIPLFLVSFTINQQSSFLKLPVSGFYKSAFQKFTCIFVQNQQSFNILQSAGFNRNTIVTGSTRMDRIADISKESFDGAAIEKFVQNKFCVIAGSTHTKDVELFLETYAALKNEDIKWILVPHDIHEEEIQTLQNSLGAEMVRFSEIAKSARAAKVLCIDKVGFLAKIYRYTTLAYVGGGFLKTGIHNILEPAVYGCPVSFGPNYNRTPEAFDLMASGGAETITTSAQLIAFINKYRNNPSLLKQVQQKNSNYVYQNAGATAKTLAYLGQHNYIA